MLLALAFAAQAASWDTGGNGMLNGTYYFRHMFYILYDQYGDLSEAITLYGTITFDGAGHYTLSSGNWFDYDSGNNGARTTGTLSGTYSIASSGYGFLSNPLASSDNIYGLVSSQGIFSGSSTDNAYGYNDFFVAAPLASPAPTNSSFSGTYMLSNLDLSYGQPAGMLGMMLSMMSLAPERQQTINKATENLTPEQRRMLEGLMKPRAGQ